MVRRGILTARPPAVSETGSRQAAPRRTGLPQLAQAGKSVRSGGHWYERRHKENGRRDRRGDARGVIRWHSAGTSGAAGVLRDGSAPSPRHVWYTPLVTGVRWDDGAPCDATGRAQRPRPEPSAPRSSALQPGRVYPEGSLQTLSTKTRTSRRTSSPSGRKLQRWSGGRSTSARATSYVLQAPRRPADLTLERARCVS